MSGDTHLFECDESIPLEFSCGIDEAGRGPLAGPVIAAAVVLPSVHNVRGITDSKQLTPSLRESLSVQIKEEAIAWGMGRSDHTEIDEINILQATMMAMKRAFEQLHVSVSLAQIDGNRAPPLGCKTETVIKGDSKIVSIGAASILAKVERDEIMDQYHQEYPMYGFNSNRGYYAKKHVNALQKFGPCEIHRRTFRPVCDLLRVNTRYE